jgi:hypothetical protein
MDFFLVEMPKGQYNGQKLTRLVRIKIPANTKRTIATVPEIMFVKYNTPTITAASILATLSIVPMFDFITSCV